MNDAKSISPRITTLDVIGIGLSVEMFRQGTVWNELQKHTNDSILPEDVKKYPNSYSARDLASDKRAADTLEYGASHFVEFWSIPSLSVWPYCNDPVEPGFLPGETNYAFFDKRINSLLMPAGMHTHKIASLGSFFSNEPEDVLERAFQFFDGNPQVPALLVMVSDGDLTRGSVSDNSRKKFLQDGPRLPGSMTESFVTLVLARRERVDALRPFAWHSTAGSGEEYNNERDHRAKLMQSNTGKGPEFKPSTYLPFPWSDMQIQQFDALPTIAVLHRPIRVTYRKDKDGKPTFDPKQHEKLMAPQPRQAAFKTGFDEALKEIPGGEPARVFYDAGDAPANTNFVPLTLAVHHSLPNFDLFEPHEGYDIFRRIGNTGAASPFVQWALGSMASFQNKDASIAVNLRKKEEATITVITPSTDTRQHPMGHPFNFNLAPEDGSPAVPVAPPVPAKPPRASIVSPTTNPQPNTPAAQPITSRTITLGTSLSTGDECTQSGMWRCSPPDAEAGAIHYFSAGRTFPTVNVIRSLTALQKMRGLPSSEKVAASWTLVSYDMPNV
jgi:hypothetical protein